MIYVFDTSSFIVSGHYFPDRFPSFWTSLNEMVANNRVISVKEVRNELDVEVNKQHLSDWIKSNGHVFLKATPEETDFVAEIFAIPHFLQLVRRKSIVQGQPVADPFVIAAAKLRNACVVTEEAKKKNAARIPNICEHFGISCTNLDGFMGDEGWQF